MATSEMTITGIWLMSAPLLRRSIAVLPSISGILRSMVMRSGRLLCASATAWRPFTAVMGFMLRYADVLTEKIGAQRRAMAARGHDPRWFMQAKPLAVSAGTIFVRSYEQGERIQRAMIARGYAGTMPATRRQPATRSDWLTALGPAVAALIVALVSWRIL